MEETPAFLKTEEIDLNNFLERISSKIPNKIIKIEGYMLKKGKRTIRDNYFKGFSSSTTNQIEMDLEKSFRI